MAVNINVPSQVKTYANLAAFPATGALKTIYIAEDTNKTYRWTGSVYTEISASAAMTWGTITGTLSAQTDLQTALNAKQNTLSLTTTGDNGASTLVGSTLNVPNYTLSGLGGVPTSRTLTINGVTQDLSANRTFTISTGITIGSTAITSGTVGRILFEGAGNVVQESSSLFWDATNNRLGIGTSSPDAALDVNSFINFRSQIRAIAEGGDVTIFGNNSSNVNDATRIILRNQNDGSLNIGNKYPSSGFISFECGNNAYTERMRIFQTGNVAINTTTDAGFRLDVNGTARVQTSLEVAGASGITFGGGVSALAYSGSALNIGNSATWTDVRLFTGGVNKYSQTSSITTIANTTINLATATVQLGSVNALTYSGTDIRIGSVAAGFNSLSMYVAGSERARIASTGNLLINTTTDAGFRLDVNGTSRFQGAITCGEVNLSGSQLFTNKTTAPNSYLFSASSITILNGNNIRLSGGPVCVNESGANATASSVLDVSSTTKGFLPPRMTTTQKNAIASPAAGLMVYDTTLNVISYYNGTMWI